MSFLENSSHGALLDCSDHESNMKGSAVAWGGADLLDAAGDPADFDISSFFSQLTAAAGAPADAPADADGSGRGEAAELGAPLPGEPPPPPPPAGPALCGPPADPAAGDVSLSVLLGEHEELQEALLAATEPAPPPKKAFVVVKRLQGDGRKAGRGRPRKLPPPYGSPPPAPLSAYNLFVKEQYPRLKASWRALNVRRAGRLLSNMWAGMRPAERGPYLRRASEEKARYRTRLAEYRLQVRHWKQQLAQTTTDPVAPAEPESDDDREDLYCRLCDLYFSSSHNKDEHLHSKQHVRAISERAAESVAEATDDWPAPAEAAEAAADSAEPPAASDVDAALETVLGDVVRREQEVHFLKEFSDRLSQQQQQLEQQLSELEARRTAGSAELEAVRSDGRLLSDQLEALLLVPTLFGVMNHWSGDSQRASLVS